MSALTLGRDAGGLRFFLDGRPVHCGTGLELEYDTGQAHVWLGVRLEFRLCGREEEAEAVVCLDGLPGSPELRLRPGQKLECLRFRWPAPRPDRAHGVWR